MAAKDDIKKYGNKKQIENAKSLKAPINVSQINIHSVKKNDFVVITAGLPFGKAGMTNMIRLYKVGT